MVDLFAPGEEEQAAPAADEGAPLAHAGWLAVSQRVDAARDAISNASPTSGFSASKTRPSAKTSREVGTSSWV